MFGHLPKELCADAGYGSEENYRLLQGKGIIPYVKYNHFDTRKKRKNKWPFLSENLHYNKDLDCFYCPMGQPMKQVGQQERKTKSGFSQNYQLYQALNCQGCPLRSGCHKRKNNRIVAVNHQLNYYKKQANQLLESERGLYHRSKRPIEAEAVFARLKHNWGFKRFYCRGKQNVEIEIGLLAIAHNISKIKTYRFINPNKQLLQLCMWVEKHALQCLLRLA
jgi:Pyruvate/2-oxoacid:ferredoxin oxidoreductase delta subunit